MKIILSASGVCAILLGLLFVTAAQSKTLAGDVQVKPLATYSGSVADEALQDKIPVVVSDVMALRDIWKICSIEKEFPKVDFANQIFVISTTRGSILQQELWLSAKGNLRVVTTSTKDLQPGFRYIISQIKSKGISSVDGNKLLLQRAVEPVLVVKGGTEDETIAYPQDKVIVDAVKMNSLWQTWKQKEALPAIDFSKQFVLLTVTSGSIIYPGYTISPDGDLCEMSEATKDLLPGFRFVIAVFDREGVTKINGQPLPAVVVEKEK